MILKWSFVGGVFFGQLRFFLDSTTSELRCIRCNKIVLKFIRFKTSAKGILNVAQNENMEYMFIWWENVCVYVLYKFVERHQLTCKIASQHFPFHLPWWWWHISKIKKKSLIFCTKLNLCYFTFYILLFEWKLWTKC